MIVNSPAHISGNRTTFAVTGSDDPGVVQVEWQTDGQMTGITCDGWIETDGTLFIPSDGDSGPGAFLASDGKPVEWGGWYKAETGENAIFLDGHLAVINPW